MTPEQAFDQYHAAVFDFAFRLTRSAELAEDITQDCFLALVRHPNRFDPARGSAKAYLFSIARNLALKEYRDRHPAEALDSDDAAHTDPRLSLDAAVTVAGAVAGLPPLQQEALVLFEYEGVTLEELAVITGVDVGTVKSRLHRARARLKRVLAPEVVNGTV